MRPRLVMEGQRGFSLVELLVAAALTLAVTLVCGKLVLGASEAWRSGSAAVDLQQRARAAADILGRALRDAGGGPSVTPLAGPLNRRIPGIWPRRLGRIDPDAPHVVRQDALTVLRVVAEVTPAILLTGAAPGAAVLELAGNPSCASPACGLVEGSAILLADDSGAGDLFTVTSVSGALLHVRHHGGGSSGAYAAGSPVLPVDVVSFSHDAHRATLRRYDGDASDLPVVDDVVGLEVRVFGSVVPPEWPRPPLGTPNCLYSDAGVYHAVLMPLLSGPADLVELPAGMLADGPWCGGGALQYDADLLRLRRVRVVLRLQASDPSVRGRDRARFANAGSSTSDRLMVPDVTLTFDLTPRNLQP